MGTDWKKKVESEAPGFGKVYESIRRLATFHKVEQADCEAIALVAIVEHPGCVQAAISAARHALNDERRQRLPGRPIDDRVDGEQVDEVEVRQDLRTLPEGKTLKHLNEEGEWAENEITEEDRVQAFELFPTDDRDLPKLSPSTIASAIIFLAGRGQDVKQIAKRLGRTPARIRQILRDKQKIREVVAEALAQRDLFDEVEYKLEDIT
jgi:hypothetical protein